MSTAFIRLRRAGGLAVPLALTALGAAACTAEVTTRPATVTAEDDLIVAPAPVNVYAYPHRVYRGETVYYVDGRWYRQHGSHWAYYRHEPPDLVRHRHEVEVAPPAPRRYEPPPGEAIRVR